MTAPHELPVWDDEFRTPCCGATVTYSDAVLCCRACYAEVVYDDGGALLEMAR